MKWLRNKPKCVDHAGGKLVFQVDIAEKLEKLKAYEETGASPHEVHMMNERLGKFEEAMLEPEEVMILKKRDTAQEAKIDKYKMAWCTECGEFIGIAKGKKEEFFCKVCGQRLFIDGNGTCD